MIPGGCIGSGRQGAAYPLKFQKTKRVLTPRNKGICGNRNQRNVGKEGVNTMTEKTKTLGIRINSEDKDRLAQYITRKSLESILRQIDEGEIEITEKGVKMLKNTSVNTIEQSVNTTIERISENKETENPVIEGVNTDCENCPYMNDLNMGAFDEVCEFKGIDRQKALDKCVQMLWRG